MTRTTAALMFWIWYPGPFRHLAGGVTLFFIIAAVDVVLGLLLMLVVFSPAKSWRMLATDQVQDQLPGAAPALRAQPWSGPQLIGTERPRADQRLETSLIGLSGIHLAMQPQYWTAFDSQRAQVWASGQPLSKPPPDLRRRLPTEVIYWPGAQKPALEGLRWLPVMAPRASWTVLVDPSGTPVAFAPFDTP